MCPSVEAFAMLIMSINAPIFLCHLEAMSEIHMKVFRGILHLILTARILLARVFGELASYLILFLVSISHNRFMQWSLSMLIE